MKWSVRSDLWALHGMMHGKSCFYCKPVRRNSLSIGDAYPYWHVSCISFGKPRDRSPVTEISLGDAFIAIHYSMMMMYVPTNDDAPLNGYTSGASIAGNGSTLLPSRRPINCRTIAADDAILLSLFLSSIIVL